MPQSTQSDLHTIVTPLSAFTTAMLAICLLVLNLFTERVSIITIGSAVLLLLAIGCHLRLRWSMAMSLLLAAVLMVPTFIVWMRDGIRPPYILILLPPLVFVSNAVALFCLPSSKQKNPASE